MKQRRAEPLTDHRRRVDHATRRQTQAAGAREGRVPHRSGQSAASGNRLNNKERINARGPLQLSGIKPPRPRQLTNRQLRQGAQDDSSHSRTRCQIPHQQPKRRVRCDLIVAVGESRRSSPQRAEPESEPDPASADRPSERPRSRQPPALALPARSASLARAPADHRLQARSAARRNDYDGASETRTRDLLGAIQALSQLSYSPGRRHQPLGRAVV